MRITTEEIVRLRAAMDSYLEERKEEESRRKIFKISGETLRYLFDTLAETGITFTCAFEKLDGTERVINARMLGPVQFNYRKRQSYANVVDIDLPVGANNDRKIVLQRVERVIYKDCEYVPVRW